jgi:2',3'-cyclic-nucleotide 2'-phosphodiesterase (5'-nucleotidase family)
MEETNFGSFVADMVRAELNTDFSMIGGGCLRMDEIIPIGELKMEFLHKLLPFPDEAWTLEISG